ncbi:30S ribosomal protein S8 [Candidatus Saccharibacteria bacterium]|nr:30S ribosomal protein S8 [Candidatus Saccharibacteria bacterium]NCS82897.1 30S ribosomal protein S8 [Candidatus Saccharibacteria bacterium]
MSLQSTDPIADLLTRIRNAVMVGKNEITVPSSKLKVTVAKELQKAGYVIGVKVEPSKPRDTLVVTINEPGENAVISEIKRLSKPGRRVYVSATDIPRVKSGRGVVLVSTSKGILSGNEAIKQKLGGELLLQVY